MLRSPRLVDWCDQERDRILTALCDWVRIASISAFDDHDDQVLASANLCSQYLHAAGLRRATVLDTDSRPAVYAEWLGAAGAPTVLVFGHHDVQPAAPLDQWDRPPFEPEVVDGHCHGRGVSDAKGPLLSIIEATRGLLATEHVLPVNVKFLIHAEDTIANPNLRSLLEAERERLRADVVLMPAPSAGLAGHPAVPAGLRGLLAFDMDVRTGVSDLHAGEFGGTVPNAIHWLVRLIGDLHSDDGKVAIPGFYHRVRELSPLGRQVLATIPFDEEQWQRDAGVSRVEGEWGYTVLERLGTRPSCDVVSLIAGNRATALKTVVPSAAHATLALHLVPDQDPMEVEAAFRSFAEARVPEGVELDILTRQSLPPSAASTDHPAFVAVLRALKRCWGEDPVLTRHGGSAPSEVVRQVLRNPALVYLSVGTLHDRIHAPNEQLALEQFWKNVLTVGELWHEIASRVPAADAT